MSRPKLIGQQLGAYTATRLIGRGGTATVYAAVKTDAPTSEPVAIKVIRSGLVTHVTLRRFRREREILARLAHRNIIPFIAEGIAPDGRPFLVMELVEGEPIIVWCADHRSSLRDRLDLFRQTCDAVECAHQLLIVHRDVKPGNIMVTRDGTVKLLDFGLAKLLEQDAIASSTVGMRTFTPEYASPEQVRGEPLTVATDIYSLGVVLFELLTGTRPHPFANRSLVSYVKAVRETPAPRPSAVATHEMAREMGLESATELRRMLEGALDDVVLRALEKEPARRYASVKSFASGVEGVRGLGLGL